MLSAVLRSKTATQVSLAIIRTFVRLRKILATNEELARKMAQHDHEIEILFEHVRSLVEPAANEGKTKPVLFALGTNHPPLADGSLPNLRRLTSVSCARDRDCF